MRRSAAHPCSNILFKESAIIELPQANLLANANKEDLDRGIIETALSESAVFVRIIVIGEDVDTIWIP